MEMKQVQTFSMRHSQIYPHFLLVTKILKYFNDFYHWHLSIQFLKKSGLENKRMININCLIITLLKMRLLIILVFSQHGLPCKYEIIFYVSTNNWM